MADEGLTQLHLYDAFVRRKRLVLVIAIFATIGIALFAVSAGSLHIPVSEVSTRYTSDWSYHVIFGSSFIPIPSIQGVQEQ